MTPEPQVMTADQLVSEAARIMRDFNVGSVPIVDDRAHMHPRGIITDRDLVVRCMAERHGRDCAVGDHMSSAGLATIDRDADVAEVIQAMERHQVRRLMVTEEGRLVGIIAQADVALREGPLEPLVVEHLLERISTR
jgi:CBS domain-containing protein